MPLTELNLLTTTHNMNLFSGHDELPLKSDPDKTIPIKLNTVYGNSM